MVVRKPFAGLMLVAFWVCFLAVGPPCERGVCATEAFLPPKGGMGSLTIAQAVTISVARNLRMADAKLAIEEKEHERRAAFSDFLPTLNVQYVGRGYRYQQQANIFNFFGVHDSRWVARLSPEGATLYPNYPYRIDPYRLFTISTTLTQPIFSGGQLTSDYKYARLGVDYATIQSEVDRQNLILKVYQCFYQMVQGEKLLDVANQSVLALTSLRDQTKEFYRVGVVSEVDVLSTEGQLATAKIQKTQAVTEIDTQRAVLNNLLRYPQETPTRIAYDMNFRPSSYAIPHIYEIAARNRLEIQQANISVEQALALVKSADAGLMPTVSVQAQGTRMNDDWNPFDPEAVNDWSVLGVLTWSFDMFRSHETSKTRRVSEARAFVGREQLVENIMSEVKQSWLAMKRSESDVVDNRKAVEFQRENFRISRHLYSEQVATYTEVLDAQRQLANALGDYYTSLIGQRINTAILERKMGVLKN